eukprot:gb/GECH01010261.1/.p1 GENE.gb/GECH01010261.1/~~gb/GECH01010261.1/.p1  ORF type:complete len:165 (+),score=57.42 gb/GECH01010261.1/:1-495(+)
MNTGPIERFCKLLTEEQDQRIEEILSDPVYENEETPLPLGEGYLPTKEDLDKLSEINTKVRDFIPEKEWKEHSICSETIDSDTFSWSEETSNKSSKLFKEKYPDYLQEMREEKHEKQKLREIEKKMHELHEKNISGEIESTDKITGLLEDLRNDTFVTQMKKFD